MLAIVSATTWQHSYQSQNQKSVTIRRRDKPWFDSTLRKNIRTRDRLRKKALNSKKEIDWVNYHMHRNKVNNIKIRVILLLCYISDASQIIHTTFLLGML